MHNTFLVESFPHWRRHSSRRLDLANKVLARLGTPARLGVPEPLFMSSLEFRLHLFHMASAAAYGPPGDFVEVGCNAGYSSVIVQKILAEAKSDRAFHAYDSFAGLPAAHEKDENAYGPGEMAASRAEFDRHFRELGLPLPVVHEGWFQDTLPGTLPDRIAFALIDGDLYESTQTALRHVYPRLVPGAVCVFNIYYDGSVYEPICRSLKFRSPGVKRATDEFLADKSERVSVLFSGHYTSGYFRKK
jgi:O-methyltransferase